MTCIQDLNRDVLSNVMLFLHDTSRHTLFAVNLVNKALRDVAQPFLYRRCSFSASSTLTDWTLERINTFLEMESYAFVLKVIRTLIIRTTRLTNPWRSHYPPDDKWNRLATFISRLSHLQKLVFDCTEQLPLVVLVALHTHHPTAHLHIRNWTRGGPFTDGLAEELLARSACLHSISATFVRGRKDMNLTEAAFLRILALSPNLQSAKSTTRSAGGCAGYFFSTEQRRREEAKFAVSNPVSKSLKELEWGSLSSADFQDWGRFLNLSQLESLSGRVFSTDFLRYAQSHNVFKNLRHLRLETHWHHGIEIGYALTDFISTCNPLESLSIINYNRLLSLDTILLYHGLSLRALHLHQVESPIEERPTFSRNILCRIREAIPNLEILEIDINRTTSQENERGAYDALSSFPNLKSLVLHYDLGLESFYKMPKMYQAFMESDKLDAFNAFRSSVYPVVSESFGENVWVAIRGQRPVESFHLKKLTVYIGEPDRETGIGNPTGWVLEEQRARQRLEVVPNERDDMQGQVMVRISDSGIPWRDEDGL